MGEHPHPLPTISAVLTESFSNTSSNFPKLLSQARACPPPGLCLPKPGRALTPQSAPRSGIYRLIHNISPFSPLLHILSPRDSNSSNLRLSPFSGPLAQDKQSNIRPPTLAYSLGQPSSGSQCLGYSMLALRLRAPHLLQEEPPSGPETPALHIAASCGHRNLGSLGERGCTHKTGSLGC